VPLTARIDTDGDGKIEKRSLKYQRLRWELLEAERHGSSSCATRARSATR
jgi:hypothetical protein